jgi:molybdopterin-guanine dinucleotide biosynthesis protein A
VANQTKTRTSVARLAGVILAGGRSRRMRRTKAWLLLDGEPLWRRQRRVLAAAGADPITIALRPRQRSFGLPAAEIRDTLPDAGPLAGIHAALAATDAPWVAVLAVDMPAVTPAWFAALRRRCRPGLGAVFRGPRGFEPLAAIYPREALAPATAQLRRGNFAVHHLIRTLLRTRRLRAARLPAGLHAQAENWNHPGDLPRRPRGSPQ